MPLSWDANGNLTAKGDLRFHYDWRNRLTRVDLADGTDVATYAYDAFNRLVRRNAGSTTETTAWSGWQPVETYEAGQLAERRTFGLGLDELVRLEIDLDGDGSWSRPTRRSTTRWATSWRWPARRARSSSATSTPLRLPRRRGGLDPAGDPAAPLPGRRAPLQMSEEILRAVLAPETSPQAQVTSEGLTAQAAASTEPPPVSLVDGHRRGDPGHRDLPRGAGSLRLPARGDHADRNAPAAGTEVTLRIEAAGLQDLFFNEPRPPSSRPSPGRGARRCSRTTPRPRSRRSSRGRPPGDRLLRRGGPRHRAGRDHDRRRDGRLGAGATGYRLRTVDPLRSRAQTLTIGTASRTSPAPRCRRHDVDLGPHRHRDPEPVSSALAAHALPRTSLSPLRASAPPTRSSTASLSRPAPDPATGNRFGFHGRESTSPPASSTSATAGTTPSWAVRHKIPSGTWMDPTSTSMP